MSDPLPPDLPDSLDADATIMIPRPGRRPAAAPASAAPTTATPAATPPGARPAPAVNDDPGPNVVSGVNALVAAANPVLNLIPQIRATLSHPDPAGLRDYLLRGIGEFEHQARAAQVSPEKIMVARYCLCTVIDEAVASTPWGGTSLWARESLLVTLHKETWGGEKFFQLLAKMVEDPARNLDLIELLYACLCLGFKGRYRVIDNGEAQWNALRASTYQTIRQQRGEFERDLSPAWRGVMQKPVALLRQIPPWVIFAALAFVLFAVFLSFVLLLNSRSDPAFTQLASLKAPTATFQRAAAPLAQPRLRALLAQEIAQGQLDVIEDAQSSRVILKSDNFFPPGAGDIDNPAVIAVLDRVAAALQQVPGTVIVSGHTDNVPIRTLRFPSNYHLSLARANTVAAVLARGLPDSGRIEVEGMADAQPVASNADTSGRALNRRVEILLRVAG